jgi:nucleotide-binding universal stress UspA family protein
VPERRSGEGRGPVLLCYDGSDFAKRAIEQSGALLGGGPAVVLTVFESVGSALLRHESFAKTEVGRQFTEMSEDVVNELDSGAAERARGTAGEGAEVAGVAGFEARPLVRRELSRTAERDSATVWRAIIDVADEHDVALIVLGARGLSRLGSALLGSVSYGLVHNSPRPILIVPPSR